MWFRTFFGFAIALIAGVLLLSELRKFEVRRLAAAKSGAVSIVAAVEAYKTEYGKYPGLDRQAAFLDKESNAFLLQILRARDITRNSRRISFFETWDLKPGEFSARNWFGGLDPETGAFIDAWGNPYRIAIDFSGTGLVTSPYPDDSPIQASVIVWSLGKDGQQGAPDNPRTLKGSDDVVSWQ